MNRNKIGICKLLGIEDRLVKAHIIPKALTRLNHRGEGYIQAGSGRYPVRRRDSWYDSRLLSRKGEDIMTEFDTWGIHCLRQHRLVWSGWGDDQQLASHELISSHKGHGVREISEIDTSRLRLFFLSVLWRAGASGMEEFSEIDIETHDLDRIKRILMSVEQDDPTFFPISLTQFSTKGEPHNHSPLRSVLQIPEVDGEPAHNVDFFRFYFDGLISHFHLPRQGKLYDKMGPMVLGMEKGRIVLPTITFEASAQLENMIQVVKESRIRL